MWNVDWRLSFGLVLFFFCDVIFISTAESVQLCYTNCNVHIRIVHVVLVVNNLIRTCYYIICPGSSLTKIRLLIVLEHWKLATIFLFVAFGLLCQRTCIIINCSLFWYHCFHHNLWALIIISHCLLSARESYSLTAQYMYKIVKYSSHS